MWLQNESLGVPAPSSAEQHGRPSLENRSHFEIKAAKKRFGRTEDAPALSYYEAGRDGFWRHRLLRSEGVQNQVVDSARIEVNRRQRRAKPGAKTWRGLALQQSATFSKSSCRRLEGFTSCKCDHEPE